MSYLKVNINDNNKQFVEELLTKLGCEVIKENKKETAIKPEEKISPTLLFGKWRSSKIDPATFRKKIWNREISIG